MLIATTLFRPRARTWLRAPSKLFPVLAVTVMYMAATSHWAIGIVGWTAACHPKEDSPTFSCSYVSKIIYAGSSMPSVDLPVMLAVNVSPICFPSAEFLIRERLCAAMLSFSGVLTPYGPIIAMLSRSLLLFGWPLSVCLLLLLYIIMYELK